MRELVERRAYAAQERALQINPRSAMAHHYMGLLMVPLGRLDEALDHVRHAQSLEPLAAHFNANIGMIHYYAGRYETAVAQLEAALELDGSFDHARSYAWESMSGRSRTSIAGRALRLVAGRTSRLPWL
jgi:Tfp pilus assembly protein PilF